jgi:hypothetical protein
VIAWVFVCLFSSTCSYACISVAVCQNVRACVIVCILCITCQYECVIACLCVGVCDYMYVLQ